MTSVSLVVETAKNLVESKLRLLINPLLTDYHWTTEVYRGVCTIQVSEATTSPSSFLRSLKSQRSINKKFKFKNVFLIVTLTLIKIVPRNDLELKVTNRNKIHMLNCSTGT